MTTGTQERPTSARYCSSCGAQSASEGRFCAACGQSLIPPQAFTQQTIVDSAPAEVGRPSALGLNDVPGWLGWVSWLSVILAVPLLGVGLMLWCWWTYHRGGADGAGREPSERPYTEMVWRTIGWVAVMIAGAPLLLIPSLYAAVHLPTLWYKQGLRVRAADGAGSLGFPP